MCFSLLRNRRTVQTVKLTLHNRPKPKSVIYRRPFVETNQTARISLQILAMSKSNPEDKQPDQCALTYRRARPDIPLNYPPSSPSEPQSVVPSVVPASASAAPVKGLLELVPQDRKQKSWEIRDFRHFSVMSLKTNVLIRKITASANAPSARHPSQGSAGTHYPQAYPHMPLRNPWDSRRVTCPSTPDRAFRRRLLTLQAGLPSRKARPHSPVGVW